MNMMQWKRIQAEGCEWEVRAVAADAEAVPDEDILEFVPLDTTRPTRRLAVPAGALASMDDAALLAAHRQALPIGADYYGRAGKRMRDTGS